MAVEFTPVTPVIGARISGVSLATITPAQIDKLYGIWQRHHVVVLSGLYAVHIPYRGGGDARAQVLGR